MRQDKLRKLKGLEIQADDGDDEEDEEDLPCPSGGLHQHQQASHDRLPAEQAPLPSGCGSANLEEESDDSGQGGALMAQIRQLESPVHLQNFSFGDDMPDDDLKRKKRARKIKASQEVNLVFRPLPVSSGQAAVSACRVGPVAQPSTNPAVDSVPGCGESAKPRSIMAQSTSLVCSSKDGAGKASAERPDSEGDPAGPGTVRCPPVGGGGGPVPGTVAPVAPSAVAASSSGEQRQCDGAAGACGAAPPNRPVQAVGKGTGKVLFCIGASDPGDDHKRLSGVNKDKRPLASSEQRKTTGQQGVNANEAEGTSKIGVGAASSQAVSAMEVALPPVSSDAEATPGPPGPAGVSDARKRGSDARKRGSNVHSVVNVGVVNGDGGHPGRSADPSAPPVVAAPIRSYASVTAGASGVNSLSPGSGNSVLQRRLLEALRRGEKSITVEGREVDLSFWTDRHGLAAFQEKRGGETVWSLPTTGPGASRRNVVRLRWRGSDACPPRSRVVELLLKMNFRASDIFALIHPYGTPEFDVSFVRPEGLELFWSNYELAKNEPAWRDFAVQAVSRQNAVKKVTVLTRNESLSCMDIMTWLSRYGEVVQVPQKNRDEFGIWSGAWTFMMKLKCSGGTVAHIPSSAFLGRDRILIFYQGQPKVCHRCGDPTHFSASCQVQKCALCGGLGHLAASCKDIRCNLCGELGHPFSRCPRSFANAVVTPVEGSHEVASAGEGTSRGGGAEGPVKKSKNKSPSQLRRLEARQKGRELGKPQVAGVTLGPSSEAGHATEALRDDELDEEVRRMEREKGAMSSMSSHYESMDEDNRIWLENKRKQKKKKRGVSKVPKEGKTSSPLVELSNRFLTLDEIASSEGGAEGGVLEVAAEQPAGGAESLSSGDAGSSEWETDSESGDKDEGEGGPGGSLGASNNMDTSISLKRSCPNSEGKREKGSSSEDSRGKGGSKKKAV
ncbi:hypothetical protein GDO81_027973 [Engystomops pustulosus]|uniref:CCHC-type domain-containing protein n=1 Tax=Engystomops pustulosus TaxID=76066 RepID=A0AAV6ZJS8_ENGPU|nr:hypothetical protein GDO81_027973 [Engystomops pustulosus]